MSDYKLQTTDHSLLNFKIGSSFTAWRLQGIEECLEHLKIVKRI